MSLVGFLPKILWKRGSLPIYLSFFINSSCNLRCRHCFFWKELSEPKEAPLSLEEIDRFSKSMGPLLVLCLTGGEPFLRKDIPEIARIFQRNNNLGILAIVTNGFDTKSITQEVTRLLESYRQPVVLDLSIDGIGREHDELRGCPGAFGNAVNTFNNLKRLKHRFRNLNVALAVTFSRHNQDKFGEILTFFANRLKPDTIAVSLIRGDARDKGLKNVDMGKYRSANRQLEAYMQKKRVEGYNNFFMGMMTTANSIILRDRVYKTVTSGYQGACYAGLLKGIIYSNGDVHSCEMLPNSLLGNLREEDYDFRRIWLGKRADKVREQIRETKCCCTHEGDIIVNNLFDPRVLPRVLLKSAELVASRVLL